MLEERFAVDRLLVLRLRVPVLFFADDFLAEDFLADDFFADDFFAEDFFRADGTFAPLARASLSPIAIACLRLFTLPPLPPRPLRSVPAFRFFIALRTERPALAPYLRPPDFFAAIVDLRVRVWSLGVACGSKCDAARCANDDVSICQPPANSLRSSVDAVIAAITAIAAATTAPKSASHAGCR